MSEVRCALCHGPGPLRRSHIIPKFVFDWMKEDGQGRIRGMENPNRLVQDGPKMPLLCDACEGRFSIRERWFAEDIFLPLVQEQNRPVVYDERLYYFLLSLGWRMLYVRRSLPPEEKEVAALIAQADQEWRGFLLEGKPPPTFHDVHLLVTEPGCIRRLPVPNQELYFARYADGTLVSCRSHPGRHLVYVKIPRFAAFHLLTPLAPDQFVGTRVEPASGEIPGRQEILDDWIGSILVQRAQEVHGTLQSRSAKQKEKDWQSLDQHPDSDWARAVAADERHRMSQLLRSRPKPLTQRLSITPPRVGRNDPCPCRSGKKFKHCHGKAR